MWKTISNILLNIAAVLGAICIVATILALVFGVRLVIFKSGSMDPAIPTGSLAITREVDAATVHPGDVTMVDRGDSLDAITHRVQTTAPSINGTTIITMKGDANSSPDPDPYTVVRVGLVEASWAGMGYIVAAVSNPIVMLTTTFVVAIIVGIAAWPRSDKKKPKPTGGGGGGPPDPDPDPEPQPSDDSEDVGSRV